MSTLTEIEAAIEQLPASQIEKLASWFDQYQRRNRVSVSVSEPDFVARAKAIWGETPGGKCLSEIVSEARS